MKTKEGFMLRSVGGRHIVVAVGKASESFNGLITLNESGAFLWKELAKGCTYDELLKSMLDNYDVAEMTARAGIDQFLNTARSAGLIEE
ncbi:MAG: PqqD family protein [Clostridiales bacterium]|nr:PqqD family protein [Clostridiales bacterium]